MLPEKKKPYVVYQANLPYFHGAEALLESGEYGHACEAETSTMLHIAPELVKMDQVPPKPFTSLKRNQDLQKVGAYTQVDWYAMYPHMYVGDSSYATAEKGKIMLDHSIKSLAALIRAVKADEVTPGLVKEFNTRQESPKASSFWTEGK